MSTANTQMFWTTVHRWLGLGSMLFLFLAAVTGCVLCFKGTLDAALNRDLFSVPASAQPLDPIEAVARFEAAHPDVLVSGFPLHVAPGRTIEAAVGGRPGARRLGFNEAFIDPADGGLVGVRQTGAGWGRRHLMQGIHEFHVNLLFGKIGRWFMGVMALGWLIGNGVGFYLTLPARGPFWKKWKRAWEIDWKARLRWLMLDLHRASGLWLFIGVMVLAFTSVSMNFFDEAFDPLMSAVSPAKPSPFDRPPPKPAGADKLGFAGALAAGKAEAARRGLGWTPASVRYVPNRNLYEVMFTSGGRIEYSRLGPVSLYFDAADGAFAYADDPYSDSAGRKAGRALYPLHTGEVIGPIGIAIIFVIGLATAEMCVSGFYVWWKKRRSRLTMERAKRLAQAPA